MLAGFELFERAATANARLLAVERLPAMGSPSIGDEQVGAAFLITFDAGRILLSARPAVHALHAMQIEQKDDAPGGLVSAVEEEPWWRVMGCPLAGATSNEAGDSLRLGLHASGDPARFVLLVLDGERVRASLVE